MLAFVPIEFDSLIGVGFKNKQEGTLKKLYKEGVFVIKKFDQFKDRVFCNEILVLEFFEHLNIPVCKWFICKDLLFDATAVGLSEGGHLFCEFSKIKLQKKQTQIILSIGDNN